MHVILKLRCKSTAFAGDEQEKSLDVFEHQDYQIYQTSGACYWAIICSI